MMDPDDIVLKSLSSCFGAEVSNVDLQNMLKSSHSEKNRQSISQIKELVHKYKVVVFRNQETLSAEEQIGISNWFGEIEDAGFEQHPASGDRRVLLVSNDASKGFCDFGTSGFHIDGSFMEHPNSHSIYHIVHCPTKGGTAFVSLVDVCKQLSPEKLTKWERLWLLKSYKRIRGYRENPGYVIHPLIYEHPVSNEKTLCIHQGKTSRFISDWGLTVAQITSKEQTRTVLEDIEEELSKDCLRYIHKWKRGDFIISDNLAVAHMALPETQLPPSEVGLRVMQRTVIKGTHRPWKDPLPEYMKVNELREDPSQTDDVERENVDVTIAHSFGDDAMLHKIAQNMKLSR